MASSTESATLEAEPITEGTKEESVAEQEDSARNVHGIKWFIVVCAVLSTTFLFGLDNTLAADVQPSIIQRLGEISKLPWVGTSFALGAVATMLSWGKAYGVFDIKWLYITHIFLFEVGSALCGAAPTMNALIVGRAIAGLGGSGMYVGCLNYLSVTTTVQERPLYMGLIALTWGIGTVLGPTVGGAFADSSATWRWAFYINLVIGAVFSPAYLFLLPSIDFHPEASFMQRITKQTDWLGIIVFAGAMTAFVMAISFGGSVYEWNSASEIVLWVLSGLLTIAFALTQFYHPFVSVAHKLYPTHFLRMPVMVMLQVLMVCAAVGLFVPVYYIPLYFQFSQGDSALKAAVRLMPFIIMIVVFSLANGALMPKWGYYMPWYAFGGALVLIGASLMYTVKSSTSTSSVYGYTVLLGVGTGAFLQSGFSIAQALVSPSEIPNAVSFMSIGQSFGILFGLGVAGAVFQTKAVAYVSPILTDLSPSDVRAAIAGTSSTVFDGLADSTRALVVQAITRAIDKVYVLVIGTGALTFVLACLLPKNKLFVAGPS